MAGNATFKKVPIAILGFLLGCSAALIVSESASAVYVYDRAGAVAYAKKYACNDNTFCSNSAYERMGITLINDGSDCANFVSQALNEGGNFPSIFNGPPTMQWYYSYSSRLGYTGTNSWVTVSSLYNQLAQSGRLAGTLTPYSRAAYSGAQPGDVYMYDWGEGEGYSHMAIATSNGTFVDYADRWNWWKNYNSVTNGVGSKIAQHSRDRDGAPWNWGFWTQLDPTIQGRMKTKVLQISSVSY